MTVAHRAKHKNDNDEYFPNINAELELLKLATPTIVIAIVVVVVVILAALFGCVYRMRAENKLKCAKSTLYSFGWRTYCCRRHRFRCFQTVLLFLFCFVFCSVRSPSFFFSFFICFHLCRLASSSCIVGGWLLDVRASVYISAATVCAVCCVCAIIDINAKHQNVFQQLCVSFDAWLALAVAARPHLTCCCVVKLWRRQQCLNILRYHGAMKRNCVRMRLPLAPCVSCV